MTECLCNARIGERHTVRCPLTGVVQPKPHMRGHPSVTSPGLRVLDDKETARRLHLIEHLPFGCPDPECDICGGNPFEDNYEADA